MKKKLAGIIAIFMTLLTTTMLLLFTISDMKLDGQQTFFLVFIGSIGYAGAALYGQIALEK